MTTQTVSRVGLEKKLASESFEDFLDYVKILQPKSEGGGIVDFQKWPHLVELAGAFGKLDLIVLVKPKQVGASWEAASLGLWTAQYHEAGSVLMYSKGELESKDLLAKSKFVYDHLPPHLQVPLKGEGNSQELIFPSMNSRILALPSTKAAGIGFTAARVIIDEADFHEWLAETYDTAAKPTIDAGGKLLMLSTINPATTVSPFKTIVRGAGDKEVGSNGFARFFYPFDVRPGRDQAWYDAGLASSLDPAKFQKNYPRSLEEAMEPSQALAAFDLLALKAMMEETKPPIETHGTINIYRRFVVGHSYTAFSDPAKGTGGDDAVTVVLDITMGACVADIQSNAISVEQLAFDSVNLLKMYGYPVWGIEENDWGKMVIGKAQELEYPNLYERSKDNVGWHTGEHNRYMLWGELMEAIHTRSMTVFSMAGLEQFTTVIRNPNKNSRIEAMEGTHDDYPFAMGGAWQMRKYIYDSSVVRPYKVG